MELNEHLLRRNALLGRYAFGQLRPGAIAVSVAVYATTVALILILNVVGAEKPAAFLKNTFVSLAVLQVIMLWILGMYNAGSALVNESAEKCMDFFRLLPMSPLQKIGAILAGRNLLLLAAGAVNTAILLGCAAGAGISLLLAVEFALFTWVSAAALAILAILSSTQAQAQRHSEAPKLAFVAVFFVLPYLIGLGASWNEMFPRGAYVSFFAWPIRLFPFLTAVAVYLGGYFLLALYRRFQNELAPGFRPAELLAGITLGLVLALGLFWPHLEAKTDPILSFYVMSSALFLTVVPTAYRKWEDYQEVFSRDGVPPGWRRANPTNLAPAVGAVLIWALFALVADYRADWKVAPAVVIPVAASFWLVLLVLIEAGFVHAPAGRFVVFLAWFLAFLYVGLPLVAAGVARSAWLASFSPFGYFIYQAESEGAILPAAPLLLNIPLLGFLGWVIAARYRSMGLSAKEAG